MAHPGAHVREAEIVQQARDRALVILHPEAVPDTIEVGKLADLVILDRNPLEVPPLDLDDLQVVRTMVGGRTVFQR